MYRCSWCLLQPPSLLKEQPLKERVAPHWLKTRDIMNVPLREQPPEGTAQTLIFPGKTRFFLYFSFKMYKFNHENNFLKY